MFPTASHGPALKPVLAPVSPSCCCCCCCGLCACSLKYLKNECVIMRPCGHICLMSIYGVVQTLLGFGEFVLDILRIQDREVKMFVVTLVKPFETVSMKKGYTSKHDWAHPSPRGLTFQIHWPLCPVWLMPVKLCSRPLIVLHARLNHYCCTVFQNHGDYAPYSPLCGHLAANNTSWVGGGGLNVEDGGQVNNTHGYAPLTNVKKYCTGMWTQG